MGQQFEEKKQMILDIITSEEYKPLKFKELAYLLQVSQERKQELREVLDALISDGKIMVTEKGKYQKLSGKALVGTFLGTQKGFGFVSI